MVEGEESIVIDLQNPTAGAIIVAGQHTVLIGDNDFNTYPIGTIAEVDINGVVDSLGVKCWIHGLTYGFNLRPGGEQFTIIDHSGGIEVFNFNVVSGYAPIESDSIAILGTVMQFNGKAQFSPDSIILFNTGNTLKTPTLVTSLNENTESDLVRLTCLSIIDTSQWAGTGSGDNVDVTNGIDTFVMRIDADVDLFGTPAPIGSFSLTGVGGQFDPSNPYLDGYQVYPRYLADIVGYQESTIDTFACDQYMVPSGDETYSVSGSYRDTILNSDGCDSIMTINLTILSGSNHEFDTIVCDQYTVPSGAQTLMVGGRYYDTIPNTADCDSIMTINLTILSGSSHEFDTTVCDQYTLPSGSQTFFISGTYYDTIPNTVGCDSIMTINLTISDDPLYCGFQPCIDSVVIDSVLLASDPHQSVFWAANRLIATGIVTNGNAEVLYFISGGSVDLVPGFEVQLGAELTTIFEDCIFSKSNHGAHRPDVKSLRRY